MGSDVLGEIKPMDKYIKNGKVAVLYSPGYGAGWYTWNREVKECVFHPELVILVKKKIEMEEGNEDYSTQEIKNIVRQIGDKAHDLFGQEFYTGGAEDLTIAWIEPDTAFRIDEYDGFETIKNFYDDMLTT